jgi:hypothetical protein
MTKPNLQVIDGGALGASEIDAAIAAVDFAPALERPAAEWLAGRAERDAFAAAEQVTAAVAILAKTKTELVAMLVAAGGDQAAEAHAALTGALVGAEAQLAILRAAEVRFAIARAAAGRIADHSHPSRDQSEPQMNMLVTALTVAEDSLPVTLSVALEGAADLARAEKAPATKRAYASDFAIFRVWCAEQGLCPLPAEPAAVAAFIAAEAARGVKCATLGRRVAGIRHAHKLAGLSSPTGSKR